MQIYYSSSAPGKKKCLQAALFPRTSTVSPGPDDSLIRVLTGAMHNSLISLGELVHGHSSQFVRVSRGQGGVSRKEADMPGCTALFFSPTGLNCLNELHIDDKLLNLEDWGGRGLGPVMLNKFWDKKPPFCRGVGFWFV